MGRWEAWIRLCEARLMCSAEISTHTIYSPVQLPFWQSSFTLSSINLLSKVLLTTSKSDDSESSDMTESWERLRIPPTGIKVWVPSPLEIIYSGNISILRDISVYTLTIETGVLPLESPWRDHSFESFSTRFEPFSRSVLTLAEFEINLLFHAIT